MSQDIGNSIVGIKDDNGTIQGTGFVIADKVIVTCEHVIKNMEMQPGDTVKVVFSALQRGEYTTEVSFQGYQSHNDIAILVGLDPLPSQAKPVALCSPSTLPKPAKFLTRGYRKLGNREGIPAWGTFIDEVSAEIGASPPTYPSLILESQQIAPGMSGSPLFIPAIQRVVGIINSYFEPGPEGKDQNTARAMPAEVILEAWPALRFQPHTADSLDTQILIILYNYQQKYFGESDMSLNQLVLSSGVKIQAVQRCLFTLQKKRWLQYELTRRGEAGLVSLTSQGFRVAESMIKT